MLQSAQDLLAQHFTVPFILTKMVWCFLFVWPEVADLQPDN